MIDLPDDIQRMETSLEEQKVFKPDYKKLVLDKNKVNQACSMIAKSKRPIFIIGNGIKISESKKNVDELLQRTKLTKEVNAIISLGINLLKKKSLLAVRIFCLF